MHVLAKSKAFTMYLSSFAMFLVHKYNMFTQLRVIASLTACNILFQVRGITESRVIDLVHDFTINKPVGLLNFAVVLDKGVVLP